MHVIYPALISMEHFKAPNVIESYKNLTALFNRHLSSLIIYIQKIIKLQYLRANSSFRRGPSVPGARGVLVLRTRGSKLPTYHIYIRKG